MSQATIELLDGHIAADEMYSLAEIKRRLGLGAHALLTARRQGLRVLRIGRNDFVLGKDLIRYALEMHHESSKNACEMSHDPSRQKEPDMPG